MRKLVLTLTLALLSAFAFSQSAAYSLGAKRFDPVVSADLYKLKGTPLGDLDGLVFVGYRKDGDNGLDTAPIGLGGVKRFPFGENLSFQLGLHVITAKGSPIDGGFLLGLAYQPTPSSRLTFGPTRQGLVAEFRFKF